MICVFAGAQRPHFLVVYQSTNLSIRQSFNLCCQQPQIVCCPKLQNIFNLRALLTVLYLNLQWANFQLPQSAPPLLLPPLPTLQTRQMVGKYFLIFLAACTFGHKPTDCCSCHSLAAAAFSAATAASAAVAASALLFFLLLKLFFQLSRCIAIETETEKALDFHRSPKVADDDDDDDDVVLAKVINLRSEWRAYTWSS